MGTEKGEEKGGSGAREGCMRIYVGGLGGSVSSDDLKKTFTSPQLGIVNSVEIVRTKDRSFAYLDFQPVSDKGLAKLFSMYNGCMWKGGRLRLEKAKEHYLIRMNREWAEDAELSSDSENDIVDAVEVPPTQKLLKVRNSDMQLRIFFPKLMKVKPLPFNGTGKHKYSFQRIQVPSLPSHFCDCEEHAVPFGPGKKEPSINQEKESGGVDDEELSMMNSIMSKIFEKESYSEPVPKTDNFATEAYNSTSLNDDLQCDDALADQGSDDDLIINVVAESNSNRKNLLSSIRGSKPISANQASKARPVQRMPNSQEKMFSNKKRKAPHDEEASIPEKKVKMHNISDNLEIVPDTQPLKPRADIPKSSYKQARSQKSAFKDLVSDKNNATFRISDITSDISPEAEAASNSNNSNVQRMVEEENKKIELPQPLEKNRSTEVVSNLPNAEMNKPEAEAASNPTNSKVQRMMEEEDQKMEPPQPLEENRSTEVVSNVPNAEINKLTKSTSWSQKSSWMQLVGSSTSSSFSISHILPSLNVEKQELPPVKDTDALVPINRKDINLMKTDGSFSTGQVSKPQIEENKVSPGLDGGDQSNSANKLPSVEASNEASTSSPSKKKLFRPKPTFTGTTETFSFMRSASSMNEWKKTKAALSGSMKKKKHDEK